MLVVGSALLANVFSYAFHFVLSRKLGPDQYGTLATVMAIAGSSACWARLSETVAMQETARLWSAHLDSSIPSSHETGKFVLGFSAIIALALLILSVPLSAYLHVVRVAIWICSRFGSALHFWPAMRAVRRRARTASGCSQLPCSPKACCG